MSNEIDDGGPAFPHGEIVQDMLDENGRVVGSRVWTPSKGMTLRDWLAGQALQGRAHRLSNPYNDREILAADCYEIADAMLAARKGAANGN
jgi:hypothetical protein